jgi:hypothetical protein
MNHNALQYLLAQSHYAQHRFDYKKFKTIQRVGKFRQTVNSLNSLKSGGLLAQFPLQLAASDTPSTAYFFHIIQYK